MRKENYFGNIFTDIVRFIFYFEKCLVRSVIVINKLIKALPGLILMGPTTQIIAYLA